MESQLQHHLSEIEHLLSTAIASALPAGMDGLVEAKRIELSYAGVTARLELAIARLRAAGAIHAAEASAKRAEAKTAIDSVAHAATLSKPVPGTISRAIVVLAPGVDVVLPLTTLERAPVMQYSAVRVGERVLAVYRYTRDYYVSCGGLTVDNEEPRVHSASCANIAKCTFGRECRYYHDPLIWPNSTHRQHVSRTALVRGCPYFGDTDALQDHLRVVTFEQLRTLARYVATMNLLIFRAAIRVKL